VPLTPIGEHERACFTLLGIEQAEVKRLNELLNHINELAEEVIDDYTRGNDILLAIHETTSGKITEVREDD